MLDIKKATLFDIESYYNDLENDLARLAQVAQMQAKDLADEIEQARTVEELRDAIIRAKCFDIDRLKRSQGGRKSASNMTKEQRQERARKAGRTTKKGKA